MTGLLAGLRVMVPVTQGRRGNANAPSLSRALTSAGAVPIEVEFIAIEPALDAAALQRAVRDWCAGEYAWMAVTSRNAALALGAVARELGLSLAAAIPPARVAAVGQTTRVVCEEGGLTVALLPSIATGSGLAEEFPSGGGKVLIPLGDRASAELASGIGNKGWTVTTVEAYRTVPGRGPSPEQVRALRVGQVDAVFLTSGSMAAQLAAHCANIHPSTTMVAIGPTTAAAALAAGLRVAQVAERPTYQDLMGALERSIGRKAP